MSATRWKDEIVQSIDEAVEKALQVIEDEERQGTKYWKNMSCRMYDDISTMDIDGEQIRYCVIKYCYEVITVGETEEEDSSVSKSGMLIIYQKGHEVFYIIDQNQYASKLIRLIFKYTNRGEITKIGSIFDEEFFVWIINRIKTHNNTIDHTIGGVNKQVKLLELKRLKGDTEDCLNKVSTKGESLLNNLSTLSFLSESKKINQIDICIKFKRHNKISIILQKNALEITNPYSGEYDDDLYEEQLSKLYLLVYLEILPFLKSAYAEARRSYWNEGARRDFIQDIKGEIIAKVS